MRRIQPLDKALLLITVPLWALCFVLSARSQLEQRGFAPVYVSAPAEGSAHPVVSAFRAEGAAQQSGLRTGDRLLRVGAADLGGVGPMGFFLRFSEQAGRDGSVRVAFERGGETRETSLAAISFSSLWPLLVVSLGFALTAILAPLRARPSPLVRAGFLALMSTATVFVSFFAGSRLEGVISMAVHVACTTFGGPLFLRAAWLFPSGVPPAGRVARLVPWLFLVFGPVEASATYGYPFAPGVGYPATLAVGTLSIATGLLVATRNYLRADAIGRRQLKWLMFGVYCACIPPLAVGGLLTLDPGFLPLYVASLSAFLAIPFSLMLAVARYNLFDVDRLISSTASYNILIVLVVAAGFVVVPRTAAAASAALGIDPETGQVLLSLVLAALVVPAHRRLRPRIERIFFAERWALDQGVEQLLRELSQARDAADLTTRIGAGLHRLIHPTSCVIYGRSGAIYAPLFVEGRAVPPALEAGGPMLTTLRQRRGPRSLEGDPQRSAPAAWSPFDRAALDALDAAVLVPIWHGEELFLLVCLGTKRSEDVYTPTDQRLLATLADRASAELLRFDQAEVIREAHAMQDALRRFVPGAIADQLELGGEVVEGERHVSVLFVDIRGYTSLSVGRRPDEVFSTVNRYTQAVSRAIRSHGGHVVEFNGDGMMAIFGAPGELAAKERAAVAAGREILAAVAALPADPGPSGQLAPLSVGVGIATGPVYVGSVQAVDRMIWSAIGQTTNLAARLQGLTRELGAAMVIDAVTRDALGAGNQDLKPRERIDVRGLPGAHLVYCLPLAS